MDTVDSNTLPLPGADDRAEWFAVVHDNAAPLYRAIHSMGLNGTAAEELLQDVFVAFLSTPSRDVRTSGIRIRLFGLLYKRLFDSRPDLMLIDPYDPIDDWIESRFTRGGAWIAAPSDMHRILGSPEATDCVHACVDSLPPLQRAAFELRKIEELSLSEIATALGVSASSCGILLHRAQMRLRHCLEDWEADS